MKDKEKKKSPGTAARRQLSSELESVDGTIESRLKIARSLIIQPKLILPMLDLIAADEDPISRKASWILDFMVREDISCLFPHLQKFTLILGQIHCESTIRPIARICECLVLDYYSPGNPSPPLTKDQLEQIATQCFDWLIGDHKVAAKAYSMTCLFHLGRDFPWIHPELALVVEQEYPKGSAAYQARARRILRKLKR